MSGSDATKIQSQWVVVTTCFVSCKLLLLEDKKWLNICINFLQHIVQQFFQWKQFFDKGLLLHATFLVMTKSKYSRKMLIGILWYWGQLDGHHDSHLMTSF